MRVMGIYSSSSSSTTDATIRVATTVVARSIRISGGVACCGA